MKGAGRGPVEASGRGAEACFPPCSGTVSPPGGKPDAGNYWRAGAIARIFHAVLVRNPSPDPAAT